MKGIILYLVIFALCLLFFSPVLMSNIESIIVSAITPIIFFLLIQIIVSFVCWLARGFVMRTIKIKLGFKIDTTGMSSLERAYAEENNKKNHVKYTVSAIESIIKEDNTLSEIIKLRIEMEYEKAQSKKFDAKENYSAAEEHAKKYENHKNHLLTTLTAYLDEIK